MEFFEESAGSGDVELFIDVPSQDETEIFEESSGTMPAAVAEDAAPEGSEDESDLGDNVELF